MKFRSIGCGRIRRPTARSILVQDPVADDNHDRRRDQRRGHSGTEPPISTHSVHITGFRRPVVDSE